MADNREKLVCNGKVGQTISLEIERNVSNQFADLAVGYNFFSKEKHDLNKCVCGRGRW